MSIDEVRQELSDVNRSLGRIEGSLEGFDERFERLEKLDDRVRALEGWKKWMAGVQAAVVALMAWAVGILR